MNKQQIQLPNGKIVTSSSKVEVIEEVLWMYSEGPQALPQEDLDELLSWFMEHASTNSKPIHPLSSMD